MTTASRKVYEAPRLEERGRLTESTLGAWISGYEPSVPPHQM
jgi:hypothetical protein